MGENVYPRCEKRASELVRNLIKGDRPSPHLRAGQICIDSPTFRMGQTDFRSKLLMASALWLCTAACGVCQQPDLPEIEPVTGSDRLLILAPHEDDEAIGAGGLIQAAVSAGAKVRVVYLTYGDHNEWAFIKYRKFPWLTPGVNRSMGELRRKEAIEAMAHLGLREDDLVFLGFPDNGTLAIWKQHWDSSPPMHSLLTNTRRVPYRDAVCYDKPYKGEEILAAIESQLLSFRPTRIFVTHPLDGNPDHRAYYLFLQVALLKVADHIPTPQVLTYPVHMGPWPRPAKYRPEDWLQLPRILAQEDAADWMFLLTSRQVDRKFEAIGMYKTQISYSKSWLTSFARRNELFSMPAPVLLQTETEPAIPTWSDVKKVSPTGETDAYEQETGTNHLSNVVFCQSRDGLVMRVTLRRPIDDDLSLSVYAFGARKDRPFALMPKLNILWQDGSTTVRDQKTAVRKNGVAIHTTFKEIVAVIPWSTMGLPDTVFVQVQGLVKEVPISQTGWQILSRAPFTSSRSKR